MRESGRNYTIENCHWGDCTDGDDSSCPTKDWCPWNWYRTSQDINSGAMSWLSNLQTTTRFQDYDTPLSVPGCWSYPDMLEVGRVVPPLPAAGMTWNRAHFGAWCIVSGEKTTVTYCVCVCMFICCRIIHVDTSVCRSV